MKVLYVEDDKLYRNLVQQRLDQEFKSGSCSVVASMAEYEHKMKSAYRPDVILMDIMLPDKPDGKNVPDGGIKLAEMKLHGEIPIIFISMWSPEEYEERRKKIDCAAYINRPIKDWKGLTKKIRELAGVKHDKK